MKDNRIRLCAFIMTLHPGLEKGGIEFGMLAALLLMWSQDVVIENRRYSGPHKKDKSTNTSKWKMIKQNKIKDWKVPHPPH